MKETIADLLQVPPSQHDIMWLRQSLQLALELELSTLPPYLCAAYSINGSGNGDPSDVYDLIMGVAYEEMLHFGLACNMLAAAGGTPQVLSGYQSIAYPGMLPGGVLPGLKVYLADLSYLLSVCMAIEYPESGPLVPPPTPPALMQFVSAESTNATTPFFSIGAFYDAISAAFTALNPTIQTQGQVAQSMFGNAPADVTILTNLADVQNAIALIKQEGEGTSQSVDEAAGSTTPAHYYRFAQIYYGAALVQTGGTATYTGKPITFPAVFNMPPVPLGGYKSAAAPVQAALNAFNTAFTNVLNGLDAAWHGDSSGMNKAIGAMVQLTQTAPAIFAFPLPDGSGVYGPTFQLVS